MARFAPLRRWSRQSKCIDRQVVSCPQRKIDTTLADVTPGSTAKIRGFCGKISGERCSHLQAYGLVPGNLVKVLQHSPVTVVQIDHTELAMEVDLACEIQVEDDLYLYTN
jgi:Fe2+ transport system protein FeoA